MLLRSASTPLLNSWIPQQHTSPEPEILHNPIPKARSISLYVSASSPFSSPSISSTDDSCKRIMTRALSESNLRDLAVPKKNPMNEILNGIAVEEVEEEKVGTLEYGLDWAAVSGGFIEESTEVGTRDNGLIGLLVSDGVGGGGSKICGGGGGGGSDGGDDGTYGFGDSNRGNDSTDVYYQKMIEANPGNSLLLSNYARFLKEVRGDFEKAEMYCGRAILMNPNDGDVLSMYADLIWQSHKDASRAESYFDQAVKASPDDCYVIASYARFLWDAEEEGEEEEEVNQLSSPTWLNGAPPPPPITASS